MLVFWLNRKCHALSFNWNWTLIKSKTTLNFVSENKTILNSSTNLTLLELGI